MVNQELKEYIFSQCKENGIQEASIYYSNRKTTHVNVENGEIGAFSVADEEGINISGNVDGWFGSVYVERLDEEAVREAVNNLRETAPLNGKKERKNRMTESRHRSSGAFHIDMAYVVEQLKGYQQQIRQMDERVVSVPRTSFDMTQMEVMLVDENLTELRESYGFLYGGVGLVVREGGKKQNAYAGCHGKNFEELDYLKIGKRAVKKASDLLSASPIKSGEYPVVLENHIAADVFSYFMPIFTAESVQRKNSKYAGRVGEKVAAECFTMFENPQAENAMAKRSFDDEGVLTERKYFIQNGELKHIINCVESAGEEALTGNGFRPSYKTNAKTAAVNTYIEPGTRDTRAMLMSMPECVFITEADGLFAGVNAKTGDFSVIASGYLVRNGEAVQAVNQITVGGNFYRMVQEIEELSSDVASNESEENYFESPSILIKGLKIGGL